MKKDYIENMPAGKEMDEMVAEKVMGWHKGTLTFSDGSTLSGKEDWLDAEGHYMHGIKQENGWYEDDEDFHLLHWHPSESILWAWEVVEKMLGEDCFGESLFLENHGLIWDAGFREHAYADTAPLAICRAALLTVMRI